MASDGAIGREDHRSLEKTVSALFDISDAVSHTRNLENLYRVVHNALDRLLGVDHFFIGLWDPEAARFSFPYYISERLRIPGETIDPGPDLPLIGKVVESKAPLMRFRPDIRRAVCREDGSSPGTVAEVWLGAPLTVGERVMGAVVIKNLDSAHGFHRRDLNLLDAVSRHLALAIERREAETRISDQGKILEKILESSPVGIALVEGRRFKRVNAEMVRMFGYDAKQELEGKSVEIVYGSTADFEFGGKTIFQELTGMGKADYETDMVRRDGSCFPVHVRLNSPGSNGMSWTIGTFTDMSQRRAAEQETFERERLQGVLEMAGAVCHEINQPLQAIIGYSELMLMDPGSPKSGSSLDAIKAQAGRLGKITSTLANITRYKTVAYPGNTKIVDIWGAGPPEMK